MVLGDNFFGNLNFHHLLHYPEIYNQTSPSKKRVENSRDKRSIVSAEFNINGEIYCKDHINIKGNLRSLVNNEENQKRFVNIVDFIEQDEEFEKFIVRYNKLMYDNNLFLSSYSLQEPFFNLYIGRTVDNRLEIFLVSYLSNIYKITLTNQSLDLLLHYYNTTSNVVGLGQIRMLGDVASSRNSSLVMATALGFLFNPENKIEIYAFNGVNIKNQYYNSIYPYINYISEGSGLYINEKCIEDYRLAKVQDSHYRKVYYFKSSEINYERYKNPDSSYKELGSKEIFDILNTEDTISTKFKSYISTLY